VAGPRWARHRSGSQPHAQASSRRCAAATSVRSHKWICGDCSGEKRERISTAASGNDGRTLCDKLKGGGMWSSSHRSGPSAPTNRATHAAHTPFPHPSITNLQHSCRVCRLPVLLCLPQHSPNKLALHIASVPMCTPTNRADMLRNCPLPTLTM
jgi:hypothetical protein